ncbi:MAG TPA: nuclear transport factor 2 family protein [Thermoleophilaceae bacterium]|nr:nuclear transport factor 2 family protein [Thermoleophilaceae bacterium]
MSRENLELVRTGIVAEGVDLVKLMRDGGFGEAADPALFDPDLSVAFMMPSGSPTEYRGFGGLVEGWRDWLAPWASYEVQVEELVDAGDCVLANVVLRGETQRDAVQVEEQAAAVIRVAGGKITRIEFHLDRREARAAAGLPG